MFTAARSNQCCSSFEMDSRPLSLQCASELIADRACDSDPLRERLLAQGWDLVCPHRKGRRRKATQDGRKLRRYCRRWKIERTISWLSSFRRLVVRYEYHDFLFQGFIHLACIMICLRRFWNQL